MSTSTVLGEPKKNSSQRIARVAAPLRQELLEQIRGAIAAQEYKPGERLIERVLCERYGVSRTVVREVIRQLEAEGLVVILPNRGPILAELTADDARALFEMRAALEAVAVSWFARRATESEREAFLRSCDLVEAALEAGDIHQWLTAKDHYYELMFEGTHNEVLRSTIVRLHARLHLLRGLSLQAPGRFEQSLVEVRRVAELAVAGKADEAAAAVKAHIDAAAKAAFLQLDAPQPPETDD